MSISSQQSLSASQSATAAANQLQLLKGCGIFLCSLCCLSVLDVLAKDLVLRNSAPLVNMVRYGVIVCLSLSLMLFKRVPFYVNPSARKWLLLRGCMLGFVGICFMPAL